MKRLLIVAFAVILAACSAQPAQLETSTATKIPSPTPPVKTKIPTLTPMPSKTATQVPSATPMPDPVIIEETGDKVVDFNQKWESPTILKIENKGRSNFIVENYDESGEQIDLLVNTIGNYQGVILIGDMASENETTRFSVKSSGSWSIKAYPFDISYLNNIFLPGDFSGQYDNVIVLLGEPDLITVTCDDGYIGLWAYTESRRSLVVNEVGPYTGQSILPADTFMISIKSTGKWTVDVTKK